MANPTSTTYASRTNTTINAPDGVELGSLLRLDVITAAGGGDNPPDPTVPDGFALVRAPAGGSWPMIAEAGGFTIEWRPYYKIANEADVTLSGGSGSYTVTHATCSSQATLKRCAPADPDTPFPVAPTKATGTGSTSTATGLTTPVDGMLVEFCGFDFSVNASNITPPAGTTPTFTERFEAPSGQGLMYNADGTVATAGATGDKAITNHNPGSEPWGAALIATAALPTVPVFTDDPEATGTAKVGETVSSTFGTVSGTPAPDRTRQWQRDNLGGGVWSNISGQTAETYLVTTTDLDCMLRCLVTAENENGETSAPSNELGPVLPADIAVTIRLSGGSSNNTPSSSTGGTESSHEADGGLLFGVVTATEADDGVAKVRCVYVHNEDPSGTAAVKAYFVDDADDAGRPFFALGAGLAASGETEASNPSGTGISFSAGTAPETATDLGEIGPDEGRSLFVGLVVPPGTADGQQSLPVKVRFQITRVE